MTGARTLTRRMSAIGVAAVCVAGLLAGCTGADAEPVASPSPVVSKEPSPSPSPTLSAAEALKEANIEAAEKLIVDYNRDLDEVTNGHGKGSGDLLGYYGGDLRAVEVKQLTEIAQKGQYTTGERVVVSQKVKDYTGYKGSETVRLSACMDFTTSVPFNADGTKIDVGDGPRRFVTEYLVRHQMGQAWTIDEIKGLPDQTC